MEVLRTVDNLVTAGGSAISCSAMFPVGMLISHRNWPGRAEWKDGAHCNWNILWSNGAQSVAEVEENTQALDCELNDEPFQKLTDVGTLPLQ